MRPITTLAALSVSAALVAPAIALAGSDHDHGEPTSSSAERGSPRFVAASELFELVGELNGNRISLYLDRFADNSPVHEAKIELDVAGAMFVAASGGESGYEVVLPEAPKPGVMSITATVIAGNDTDLLTGELDVHEPSHGAEPALVPGRTRLVVLGGAGVAALAALAWGTRRAIASRRQHKGATT